ncbi:TonB-dependent receptor [Anaeromyxobacter diazotrophicus]|uniref:TonB-dependent receptor n=1 Tax=Anaeromyxobacter diazotrophicus TaxID=2590199 RepID=A0A7I9VHS7_9BACT|nr:TonB-dependent receptor [Anaeromyxobacter diazotrophicus]GEJ55688.1 TonB-dependent receptor [Anaeromyxobacter diazotrophicus]
MSRRALLLAALALGAARAAAHEPARPEFGEELVVEGHYQDRVGTSDAASAGSFTRQLVEDRPLLRPGEVLELVPGLVITQHSGAGKANQYYLRGFDLDHGTDFQTNLDGVPLNLRTHAHGQGYTDLNFLIPELVSRVDYWKGPYDASRGDFASAGGADLHYAEALPSNVLDLTGGTYGYGRALLAGTQHLLGGHLTYAGELMYEDGPWVRPDAYRRWNGVLRYGHDLGSGELAVTAMAYDGRWNGTDQIPQGAVAQGRVGRFGSLDPTTGGSSHRYSLSVNLEQEVGPGRLQAVAYAVRYDLDLFSDFTYFLEHPDTGDQFEQHDDRWTCGASASWRVAGEVAGLPAEARLGGEARQDRLRPVGLYRTDARRRLATTRQDDVDETSGGVYAEAGLRPRPWLRAVAGVRWDAYGFDVRSSDPRNSGQATAGRASPKASLVFGPWARTELFLNGGFGFHSNDARGVTTHVDPVGGGDVRPVTPLVRTRGAELGVRNDLLPGVQTSLALWVLALDSELVFTGDAGTTEPSRPSRREGVEWSARWQPVRWLLLDLDVALSRARFTSPPGPTDDHPGDHVPGSIESAVSAGASIHQLGPWSASVFLRYFGPRPLVEDDAVRSPASALLNAQLGYRVAAPLLLTLDVFNVLDARVDDVAYFYSSRVSPGAAASGDVHFHPAEPRSARLTASLTF